MRELYAHLDGELCGIFREKNGQITFTYSEQYTGTVPISLSMRDRGRTHKNKVALPFLKGLLPDNPQALDNMARQAGVHAGSTFGLLEHYGQDVAGALQLLPPDVPSCDAQKAKITDSIGPESRQSIREGFFRGLVYNVGILGTDAHAKNYSLLHLPHGVELAPMYDLISAAGHITDEALAFFPHEY